ncbi:hypothetical protein KFE25_006948 [Diacronema lutheri]|uniref:Uncharacterized protein n=2 Tax=Diacronema lutheri TaxID=2081491 RepID=A0A8J5XRV0_DIALT|nr:hypothetical protein KFE25_006948 [Diacronema lutheri]
MDAAAELRSSREESSRILRATSGAYYQTSLAAAGWRVAALAEPDRRRTMPAAQTGARELSLDARRPAPVVRERDASASRPPDADELGGTAPPTPVGHWLPAHRRVAPRGDAIAEDVRSHGPSHRSIGTEPASVHGKGAADSRVDFDSRPVRRVSAGLERSRTPEPQRLVARAFDAASARRAGPNGDDGGEYWAERLPSRYAAQWEETEAREPSVGEPLPPLPSKAELHAYIRELVEARCELRAHFTTGAFAGVKAHYAAR